MLQVHLVLDDVLPEGEVTITAKPVPEQPKPAELPAPEPSTGEYLTVVVFPSSCHSKYTLFDTDVTIT